MNVASLELCRELYELSGWEQTRFWYAKDLAPSDPDIFQPADPHRNRYADVPAYDLGYLLRKLPLKVKDEYQGDVFGVRLRQTGGTGWIVYYGEPGKSTEMHFNSADTPEDAAAKLAIELLKSGVLTSEHGGSQ